jgi:thymidylate kinase
MMKLSPDRKPILATFSGIDGAGKSTQIERLRSRLHDAGVRVRRLTFWDDVAVFKGLREFSSHTFFKSGKGVGSPEKPVERRDKNVRSWYMTSFRCFLYLLDVISLRVSVMKAQRSRADVVIYDRYIYDELANLPLNRASVRAYIRLILRIVPRPELAYLFDADPVEARQRKPEYPLEFVHTNRMSYLALSKLASNITVIGALPVSEVELQVMAQMLKELSPGQRDAVSSLRDQNMGRFDDLAEAL